MTEKFEAVSGLAARIHKEDVEPLLVLNDTFGKNKKFQVRYQNILTNYLLYTSSTRPNDDPWGVTMVWRYLCQINKEGRAGTYATRFVNAFEWFTKRAEILKEPKDITRTQQVKRQVEICTSRKGMKRETTALTMAMLEK